MSSSPVSSDNPFDAMTFELVEVQLVKVSPSQVLGLFVKTLTKGNSQPFIHRVAEGSPAEAAGMKVGDYVLAVCGHRTETKAQVGDEVSKVQEGTINFTLARRRPKPIVASELKPPDAPRRPNCNYHLCRLDPIRRPKLGMVVGSAECDVTVESVARDGLAFYAGIQARDRLVAIGPEPVLEKQQCEELLMQFEGRVFDILVERLCENENCQQSQSPDQEASFQLQKLSLIANTASAGVPEAPPEVTKMLTQRVDNIVKNIQVAGIGKRKAKAKGCPVRPKSPTANPGQPQAKSPEGKTPDADLYEPP